MIHRLTDPAGPAVLCGMLNMQWRFCQLAAGCRRLARLAALVGSDIFNGIVTCPHSSTHPPESRQPSSAEPEIRTVLILTASYPLSTAHYAPRCQEARFHSYICALENNQAAAETFYITAVHNNLSLVN